MSSPPISPQPQRWSETHISALLESFEGSSISDDITRGSSQWISAQESLEVVEEQAVEEYLPDSSRSERQTPELAPELHLISPSPSRPGQPEQPVGLAVRGLTPPSLGLPLAVPVSGEPSTSPEGTNTCYTRTQPAGTSFQPQSPPLCESCL